MKYYEFTETIKNEMKDRLDKSKKVIINPVVKNNGTIYDGLIIIDPIHNISPTIYLNSYYHRYEDGVSMEDIIEDIMKTYEEYMPEEDFDISLFKDFEKAKERIIMKVVNTKNNEELVDEAPNVPFNDLSIIFCVAVSDFMNEVATILIKKEHLQFWGIEEDELYKIAMENTPKLLPYIFRNMEDVLPDFEMPFPKEMEMYILTNQIKIIGAATIAYEGLLEHIAQELNDNFYIIPSSIHEVLIIPEKSIKEKYTFKEFYEMIEEVNVTQLTEEEVLSNNVYFYIKSDSRIIY